jgi:hypothetical protein
MSENVGFTKLNLTIQRAVIDTSKSNRRGSGLWDRVQNNRKAYQFAPTCMRWLDDLRVQRGIGVSKLKICTRVEFKPKLYIVVAKVAWV